MKIRNRTATRAVRTLATALATASLSAGIALATPAVSHAADPNVSISCSTAGNIHFEPGVQLIPTPQQANIRMEGDCYDNSGDDNGGMTIASARLTSGFDGLIISCLASPLANGQGTGTVEWTLDNGETATSQVDMRIERTVLNTAHITGNVTEGRFEGQQFTADIHMSFWQGVGDCTVGAPLGGVQNAGIAGQFTIG
ncbi:hypothetical protein [Streptomyces lavendofoliae]|uniref:hypothetical protein n=1 Tax=Streptomyces lavendofoliae TaxID=67314 RepID=UPI003D89BACA